MLDITLICFGSLKEKFWQTSANEYLKRLKVLAKIKVIELPAVSFSKLSQKSEVLKKEAEILDKQLAKLNDQVILLSESGQEFTSEKLAKCLQDKKLILVLGSALGFAESIKQKYPTHLSLSQLTLPHELARIVVLEQIYRSACILSGKQYHY